MCGRPTVNRIENPTPEREQRRESCRMALRSTLERSAVGSLRRASFAKTTSCIHRIRQNQIEDTKMTAKNLFSTEEARAIGNA